MAEFPNPRQLWRDLCFVVRFKVLELLVRYQRNTTDRWNQRGPRDN